jgi:hypothetical protein
VLADSVVVSRIMKAAASPEGAPWMWTLAFGHHEDRTPTHGYAGMREAAMAAFAPRVGGVYKTLSASEWRLARQCHARARTLAI